MNGENDPQMSGNEAFLTRHHNLLKEIAASLSSIDHTQKQQEKDIQEIKKILATPSLTFDYSFLAKLGALLQDSFANTVSLQFSEPKDQPASSNPPK